MVRLVWVQFVLLTAVFLVPQQVKACLAHYCTPQWLTDNSPLVVIAEVQSVVEAPLPAGKKAEDLHGGSFQVASVKVLRVLKGSYKAKTLRVGSGPIESCAPFACYYSFEPKKKLLLLLPVQPQDGYVCLSFPGSIRDVEDTELIESCLDRPVRYRAAYLDAIKRDSPKTYAEAVALADRMSKACGSWPKQKEVRTPISENEEESAEDLGWQKELDSIGRTASRATTAPVSAPAKTTSYWVEYEDTPEVEKAIATLSEQLRKVRIEVVRAALAVAWMDDTAVWTSHRVWQGAVEKTSESRADELRTSRSAYFTRILESAGVEKKHIESYLKAVKSDLFHDAIAFPVPMPFLYGAKRSAEDFTTEFILAYHQYDRGRMFVMYGMQFETLKDLEAGRVEEIIPALCNSRDSSLSNVGFRAIEYAKGNTFVDVILSEMAGERPGAWCYLVSDDEKKTRERLGFLAQAGEFDPCFWLALTRTGGFEPQLLHAATRALRELPAQKMHKDDRAWVRQALTEYLEQAIGHRKGVATQPSMTPDQYDEFFKKHPPPKEE